MTVYYLRLHEFMLYPLHMFNLQAFKVMTLKLDVLLLSERGISQSSEGLV